MLPLHLLMQFAQDASHPRCMSDHVLVDHDLQTRFRGGQTHGVCVVCQSAVEHVLVEMRGDAFAHRHGAERQICRRQPLGHRDHVRHDLPLIDSEPASCAPQPAHDLITNQENAIGIADRAQTLEISVGRNDQSIGSRDCLDEHGRDRVWAFVGDDLFDFGKTAAGEFSVGVSRLYRVGRKINLFFLYEKLVER